MSLSGEELSVSTHSMTPTTTTTTSTTTLFLVMVSVFRKETWLWRSVLGFLHSLHQQSFIILHSPINDYNFVASHATSNHATCSMNNRYAHYCVSQPIHHDTVALSHATESCMCGLLLQKKVPYFCMRFTYRETMVVCYLTS